MRIGIIEGKKDGITGTATSLSHGRRCASGAWS